MQELRLITFVGSWFVRNDVHFTFADDRFVGIGLVVWEIGCGKSACSRQFLR